MPARLLPGATLPAKRRESERETSSGVSRTPKGGLQRPLLIRASLACKLATTHSCGRLKKCTLGLRLIELTFPVSGDAAELGIIAVWERKDEFQVAIFSSARSTRVPSFLSRVCELNHVR